MNNLEQELASLPQNTTSNYQPTKHQRRKKMFKDLVLPTALAVTAYFTGFVTGQYYLPPVVEEPGFWSQAGSFTYDWTVQPVSDWIVTPVATWFKD